MLYPNFLKEYLSRISGAIIQFLEKVFSRISKDIILDNFQGSAKQCFGGIIFKKQQSYNHGFLKDFLKNRQNSIPGTFLQRQADQKKL